jgi:hypothetical protein
VPIASIYSVASLRSGWILKSTIRDSTMLMMIIGMSLLHSYVMSIRNPAVGAESIVDAPAALGIAAATWSWWSCRLFPPVSIILMTVPIFSPRRHFDIIWFGRRDS